MQNFLEIKKYFLNKAKLERIEKPKEYYTSEGNKILLYSAVIDLLTIKNIYILRQNNHSTTLNQVDVIFNSHLEDLNNRGLIETKNCNGCTVYAPTSLGIEFLNTNTEIYEPAKPSFEYKKGNKATTQQQITK